MTCVCFTISYNSDTAESSFLCTSNVRSPVVKPVQVVIRPFKYLRMRKIPDRGLTIDINSLKTYFEITW